LKYILTFIDDHTRYSRVYLLKSKDQTFESFKQYKALMENKTGRKILKLKSDRGGEYSSTKFLDYLKQGGIEIERGPANRPMADSVSERYNLTLLSKMRSQLIHSGLPLYLWGELAIYSCLQINCSPSAALQHQSPMEVFESMLPGHIHPFDTDRLKPFGSLCFAMDRSKKSKVAPVARRFIFVGLEEGAQAACLLDK
jgi:transposase InsO family protein